jgi:broad-specificity NMP kinase
MPGTGKSTVIRSLRERGFTAVDADEGELSEYREMPGLPGEGPGTEWVWREERIEDLLENGDETLFLSGCASNQGQFYPRFDHIVLLTVPEHVLVERLATRTTNSYGKAPDERAAALHNKRVVEPMLRRRATLEIDATAPLDDVVDAIVKLIVSPP